MNAIGGDTIQMLQAGVKEAAQNFRALVVGNDAPNFSAGANLMLLLLEAQEGNWDEIDLMVRAFQDATMALQACGRAGRRRAGRPGARRRLRDRAARRPRAGRGRNLHRPGRGRRRPDSRRRRHQGDARAGDGRPRRRGRSAAVTFSACSRRSASRRSRRAPPTRAGSATCATATTITMNRDRLLADAKALALRCAPDYRAAAAAAGDPGRRRRVLAALKLGVHLAWRAGRISDHDARHRPQARVDPGRRQPAARDDGQRTAAARPRARGVPEPVRRAEDAGADRAHAEDRQAAAGTERADLSQSRQTSGPRRSLVVHPGLQGRWEWTARRLLDALARALPVITLSRCAASSDSGRRVGSRSLGFDALRASARRRARSRRRRTRGAVRRLVRRLGRAALRGASSGARARAGARVDAGAALAAERRAGDVICAAPWLLGPVFVLRGAAAPVAGDLGGAADVPASRAGVRRPRTVARVRLGAAVAVAMAARMRDWRRPSICAADCRAHHGADAGGHRRTGARSRGAGRVDAEYLTLIRRRAATKILAQTGHIGLV